MENAERPKGDSCFLSVDSAASGCCACIGGPIPLFGTPWTVAHQGPLFMEFSRQEYWSGLPFPSSGTLLRPPHPPTPGMCLHLLHSLAGVRWILCHCTALRGLWGGGSNILPLSYCPQPHTSAATLLKVKTIFFFFSGQLWLEGS